MCALWIPKNPHVRLVMIEDGAMSMRARLEKGECDLGIVAAPVPTHFEYRFIKKVTVQAVTPHSHRLSALSGPLNVAELHREPVLVSGQGFLSTDLFHSACRLAWIEPETVYESPVGQALAALAEGGLGIAIMGDAVDLRGYALPRRIVTGPQGEPLAFDLCLSLAEAPCTDPCGPEPRRNAGAGGTAGTVTT